METALRVEVRVVVGGYEMFVDQIENKDVEIWALGLGDKDVEILGLGLGEGVEEEVEELDCKGLKRPRVMVSGGAGRGGRESELWWVMRSGLLGVGLE